MSVWSTYEARFAHGNQDMDPKWNSAQDHIRSRMRRKIVASLSYKRVKCEGHNMEMAIVDISNDFSTKKIFSMPGETLPHGSIVEWEDSFWLITELNAAKDLCTEGKMRRCNYYLKWINDKGDIIGRWCVVEDGTKYLIGEREEDTMSIGDARMAVTIGKDMETSQISRGRRFLIDDMDSKDVLAFEVTKPNKMFNVFNGKGVFRFIMGETNLTDNDNPTLRIADYYGWKPKLERSVPDTKTNSVFEELVEEAIKENEAAPEEIEKSGVWL